MRVRRPLVHPPLVTLEPYFRQVREKAGIAEGYAPDVYSDAEHARREAEFPHVLDRRSDATAVPLVTLDPEGSKDLDQALHVEATADGFRVRYAIADVGAQVAPGGPLDLDTHKRVETIYCPDRRIGLHPSVMSEGFASLLPGQRTKAVLWTIEVSATGEIVSTEVYRAWVRSRRQFSFTDVATHPPKDAVDLVAALAGFGKARRDLARRRGGVTLPRPSQEVEVHDGRLSLVFRAATGIEDDNAQVSLLTGEAAAAIMLKGGFGILRTMPPADDQSVQRLHHQAAALGVDWPQTMSYGDLLASLDPAAPRVAAFLSHATALFRGAEWVPFDDSDPSLPRPQQIKHGALGVPYAHVTAPLRRLVDRFSTEACLSIVANRALPDWVHSAMPTIGAEMSRGNHLSRDVDKACISAVECAVLQGHNGEVFDGVGLDDYTVQLAEPAIIARCGGAVQAGKAQRVRLVSTNCQDGPVFSAIKGDA